MHIVYRITFLERKEDDIKPYYYIGSKSNCTVVEGTIYDRRSRPYYGSSSWEGYESIVEECTLEVEVIKSFDNYTDALNHEVMIQKSLDVVADTRYFNKGIANVNSFTDPNYATYKNIETGKVVRLPRDHPMVQSGEYQGVSKGTKLTDEQKKKRVRFGESNGFYGRTHSQETKDRISKANTGKRRKPEDLEWFVENVAKAPRTEEWKRKIGRPNMITLKNIETGEAIRVSKEEAGEYNRDVWRNPSSISQRRDRCIYCGKESVAGNIKRWHNENCKHKPSV